MIVSDELKDIADEIRGTWETAKRAFDEQAEEVKSLKASTGETTEKVERLHKELDDLTVRLEKSRLDSRKDDAPALEAKAFEQWARKGHVDPALLEHKDVTVGNNPQAGYLVPTEYAREIIRGVTEMSAVRQVADVRTISGQSLQMPKRTGVTTAAWRGEVAAFTETNPTVGLEEIPTHELGAFVDVSMQLLEDAAFDIAGYIRDELAESFGKAEGTAFVTGSGVNQPEGFITSLTAVETATNDTFVADDVIDTYYGLKTQYAQNAVWMCNRLIMRHIRKMKGSDNNYLLQPGLADEPNWSLLGRPVYETPDMASTVADATKVLAFGDFRRGYMVVDRVGFTLMRDDYTQAGNGLVRFYGRRRTGGQVVLSEAIRVLEVN